MSIVRLLDSETDRDLLIEAWHFRDTAPRWFRECLDIFKETQEEYLQSAGKELHFGVFDGDRLFAVVRLIPDRENWWNAHLATRRGAPLEMLYPACCDIRDRMLGIGASMYGYLPERNRSIGKLYEVLGFVDSGLRIYRGVVHGKVVAWRHFWLINLENDSR